MNTPTDTLTVNLDAQTMRQFRAVRDRFGAHISDSEFAAYAIRKVLPDLERSAIFLEMNRLQERKRQEEALLPPIEAHVP